MTIPKSREGKRNINVVISTEAHETLRRLSVQSGVPFAKIVELALATLDTRVQSIPPADPQGWSGHVARQAELQSQQLQLFTPPPEDGPPLAPPVQDSAGSEGSSLRKDEDVVACSVPLVAESDGASPSEPADLSDAVSASDEVTAVINPPSIKANPFDFNDGPDELEEMLAQFGDEVKS